MDYRRFERQIVVKTAEQMGLKPAVVAKIIKQYTDAVKILTNKLDFPHMTKERFDNLKRKGVFVPGLGIFEFKWKIIESYQKKYKTREEDENKD